MNAIGYGKNEDIKNGTPPNIDILLVEQEVAASDEITALQMVVAADTKRTALLEEAKEIEQKLEEGGLKYCPIAKLDAVVEGNFAVGAEVSYHYRSEMVRVRLGFALTLTLTLTLNRSSTTARRWRGGRGSASRA
jgi:hypothetical protein